MTNQNKPKTAGGKIWNSVLQFVNKLFTKWLIDAINYLLSHLFGLTGGAILLVVVSVGLNILISYLQIPITIPAYIVAFAVTIPVALLLLYLRFKPNIQKLINARRWKSEFDMNWRYWENIIDGPRCPKCTSNVIIPEESVDNLTEKLLGKIILYEYRCSNKKCDFVTYNELQYHEMVEIINSKLASLIEIHE